MLVSNELSLAPSLGQVFFEDPVPLPAEIAFLANQGISAKILHFAAAVSVLTKIPASAALLRYGLVSEITFYRALAQELGVPFIGKPLLGRHARFPESILAGMVFAENLQAFILAPPETQIQRIMAKRRTFNGPVYITTPSALRNAVLSAMAKHIAMNAAHRLPTRAASLSFRDGFTGRQVTSLAMTSWGIVFSFALRPGATLLILEVGFGLLFFGMILVRFLSILIFAPTSLSPPAKLLDQALPLYTIVIALHREERVVQQLVHALQAFDYPATKLDIKLIIEEHDESTFAALKALDLPPNFEIITAPEGQLKTKPRALNIGLALARGSYLVVYDAEDIPDPQQLRLAVSRFAKASSNVACLQARLVIHNTRDTWLTRFFTIEYACLFDVIIPALSRFGFPIPLGGSSNHFRVDILRRMGGWDAWNVTEDADLGIRLARFGYRTLDLPSATKEEAPNIFRVWLKQRMRWMKGYMQTCITHSRHPVKTCRALGLRKSFGFLLTIPATVLSALAYPILTIVCIGSLLFNRDYPSPVPPIGIVLFLSGLVAMTIPSFIALQRRKMMSLLPFVPLMPFYYCLISLAAWLGLLELILTPFVWNKTEHGLSMRHPEIQKRTRVSVQGVMKNSRLKELFKNTKQARIRSYP